MQLGSQRYTANLVDMVDTYEDLDDLELDLDDEAIEELPPVVLAVAPSVAKKSCCSKKKSSSGKMKLASVPGGTTTIAVAGVIAVATLLGMLFRLRPRGKNVPKSQIAASKSRATYVSHPSLFFS